MRILFIAPSVLSIAEQGISDGISPSLEKAFGIMPHLSLCYLAALAREKNVDVKILEPDAQRLSVQKIVQEVERYRPDVIALTCMTFTFLYTLNLARKLKQFNNVHIWLGGKHPTLYPRECSAHRCFDIIIKGEGEKTFCALVDSYLLNAGVHHLKEVRGILFWNGDELVETEDNDFIHDLDEIPLPAIDLLPIDRYFAGNLKRPYMTLITSRGCPFRCSFCSVTVLKNGYRAHSAERVVAEIERLVKDYNIKSIDFVDDTFIVDPRRLKRIADLVEAKQLQFECCAISRVDNITEDVLDDLVRINCKMIGYGVESGSARILKSINKEIDLAHVRNVFRWTSERKINNVGFFTVGHPGETVVDLQMTVNFIKTLDIDYISANIVVPYPGTQLYTELLQRKEIPFDYWARITTTGIAIATPISNTVLPRKVIIAYRNRINRMSYFRKKSNFFKWTKVKRVGDIIRTLKIIKASFFDRRV